MADKKISELTALTGANVATDDQLVIVDTSAALTKSITIDEFKNALDTATGFVRITGDTMTGNLSMGDNVKAIFGAGSDLQIYHNPTGSHSYITESGGGSLYIQGTELNLTNAAGNSTYANFVDGGAAFIRHAGSTKLATTSTGVELQNTASGAETDILQIRNNATAASTASAIKFVNSTAAGSNSGSTELVGIRTGTNTGDFVIRTSNSSASMQEAMRIDSSQNVGIGTSSPSHKLHVSGTGSVSSRTFATDTTGDASFFAGNDNGQIVGPLVYGSGKAAYGALGTSETALYSNRQLTIMSDNTSGIIKFATGGNTERMRIDSSGRVGIGTSSPAYDLHIHQNDSTNALIHFTNSATGSTGTDGFTVGLDAAEQALIMMRENKPMLFYTNNSEAMRIDSSGNVGIGTSSPSSFSGSRLVVIPSEGGAGDNDVQSWEYTSFSAGSEYDLRLQQVVSSGLVKHKFNVRNAGTEYSNNLVLDRGSVAIGTTDTNFINGIGLKIANATSARLTLADSTYGVGSTDGFQFTASGTDGYIYNQEAGNIIFGTSAAERMRIDSSGNLIVGETSTSAVSNGTGVYIASNGQLYASSTSSHFFNRKSTNGDIATFRKDAAPVGSIGSEGGDSLYIQSGTTSGTGLLFTSNGTAIRPARNGVTVHNTLDLGSDTRSFKDLYLSGSVFSGATSGGAKIVAEAIATGTTYSASWPATGGTALYMQVNSSAVGSITTTTSATAYNTSSDYRLKTDAQPMTGATDRIKQLNPVNFEWIADGTRVDGFLAHEAQAVVPEAVTGTKDAMRDEEYEVTPAVTDDDGNITTEAVMGTRSVPDYQGIDQSKLVPLLVATIQELEARITALENA